MPTHDDGRIITGAHRLDLPEETNIDRIRQRAHELWEEEGRPEGRDRDHWQQATREILGPH